MKKCFTLFLLLISAFAFAGAPTLAPTNFAIAYSDGNNFNVSCNPGNGGYRIFVAKKGSPVVGLPVNGVSYTANSAFGNAASAFTAPGEFVVFNSYSSALNVSNLEMGTNYYFAIFEFNGTGSSTEYLMTPLKGTGSTRVPPTVGTTNVTTIVSGNSVTFNWTNGNGDNRLMVAKKGDDVDFTPSNFTYYTTNYGFGTPGFNLGNGNYGVFNNWMNSITISNLEPNTKYSFAIWDYNGGNGALYLPTPNKLTVTTSAGPSVGASNGGTAYYEGNSMYVGFYPGNGIRQLVVARKGAPVSFVPTNGAKYMHNEMFGQGENVGTDEFVVGNTSGSNVTVRNLEPNTTYHFKVFSFDSTKGGYTYYNTSSTAPCSGKTHSAPSTASSNVSINNITGNSARVNFTLGNGAYRMLVMKAGSPVNANPVNLVSYWPFTGDFGTGAQIGTGNYVVDFTGGNYINVNNLQPGITYHVAVVEFNGFGGPVYCTTTATGSFTIPNQPTVAASNFIRNLTEGNAFRINWTVGNGVRRVVIARKDVAVTAKPTDGTVYTANTVFGQGTQVAPGEYVVYDGNSNYADLKNLLPNTSYHFAIFEYNYAGGIPDYLVSPFASASAGTSTTPTVGSTNLAVSYPTSTSVKVNWTSGNGEKRIVVIKEGALNSGVPVNQSVYTPSAVFGNGSQLGAAEYVVYAGTDNQVTVSNLTASKTYSIRIFEFNGNASPVYNTTINSTITALPGGALPVKWESISAQQTGQTITIKWSTSSETNVKDFIVEKLVNNVYTVIGTVSARGTSSIIQYYSLVDNTPQSGVNQYRIKELDFNGYYSFSAVSIANFNQSMMKAMLYPNPASAEIVIRTPRNSAIVVVQIYNASGNLVKSTSITNGSRLSVKELINGVYTVAIQEGNTQYKERFIKN